MMLLPDVPMRVSGPGVPVIILFPLPLPIHSESGGGEVRTMFQPKDIGNEIMTLHSNFDELVYSCNSCTFLLKCV